MSMGFDQALVLVNQLLNSKAPRKAPSQKDELLALDGAKELEKISADVGLPPEYIVAHHIASLSKLKELKNPQQEPQSLLDLLGINASSQSTERGLEEEENPFDVYSNNLN